MLELFGREYLLVSHCARHGFCFHIIVCNSTIYVFFVPAAINMVTAATAIKANLGVTLFAYIFTAAQVGWVFLWAIAFSGTLNQTYTCNDAGQCTNPSYGLLFLLLLSFYFTQQVLQSCVHVTVAGTVGTWVRSRPKHLPLSN
jgi:putative effector of murein hydrolase LrgA (UPF0299 family)